MNPEQIEHQNLTAIGEDLLAATRRSTARSYRRKRIAKISALSASALALTASAGMAATGTTPSVIIHALSGDEAVVQVERDVINSNGTFYDENNQPLSKEQIEQKKEEIAEAVRKAKVSGQKIDSKVYQVECPGDVSQAECLKKLDAAAPQQP